MNDSRRELPREVDVVVIGGGIVGCSTAYYLAARGVSVALCEKGRIAGEQSSRNWGFVRQQGRDPAEMPMMMESMRIWRGLAGEIGEDVGYREAGITYLAHDEATLASQAAWLDVAREHQLDTRVLSAREAADMFPGGGRAWLGGLHTASDGRAEPDLAAPAIARAAARRGAHLLVPCAVRGLDLAAGRVAGVVTEHGRIAAGAVVNAGGVWASLFGGNHGPRFPQLKVQSSVLRTGPAPDFHDGGVWSAGAAFRRRDDGGYNVANGFASEHHLVPDSFRYFRRFLPALRRERGRIRLRPFGRFAEEAGWPRRWGLDRPGVFERHRVLDPAPSRPILDAALANLRRDFPALAGVRVAGSWAGLIDVTPDSLPVISEVPGLPGYFVSSGYSGHGFGIGPGAGKATAELVTGAPSAFDLSAFRFGRFGPGLTPGPG